MKNLILALSFLLLAACAGGGGGGGAPATDNAGNLTPGPTVNTYVFRVIGEGQSFVGVMYSDFGLPSQVTTPISQQVISGGPYDYTVYGDNAVGQFAFRGGGGSLTIELYKNGVLVDSDTTNVLNNSLSVDVDAQ